MVKRRTKWQTMICKPLRSKTKEWATRTPLTTGSELRCSGWTERRVLILNFIHDVIFNFRDKKVVICILSSIKGTDIILQIERRKSYITDTTLNLSWSNVSDNDKDVLNIKIIAEPDVWNMSTISSRII